MSRKRLSIFLFCLVASLIILAQGTRAGLTLRVNEPATTLLFTGHKTKVVLALENSTGAVVDQKIQLELIDPKNVVRATSARVESIGQGHQKLQSILDFDVTALNPAEKRELPWYRLRYRLESTQSPPTNSADGILSLSEITPDFIEIRVAAAEMAHEAMRYRARVQAIQLITRKPSPGVHVEGVLTLETDDDGGGVKLRAAGTTDASGYVTLFFDLPARFPEFPHNLQPAGGSIKVTAQRGGLTAEAENQVLVDQFPRILLSSDKPLYQPGQQLHLRALVLSPTKHALADQNVFFRVADPEDSVLFRETVKSSRFGIASVDWVIPENVRLGDYWVKVALGPDEDSSHEYLKLRISRYELPNFSVRVEPDHAYYLPAQNAEVKVSADYLFGKSVTRGHVRVAREVEREWDHREQKWNIEEGDKYEGETDINGVFVARVNLADDHDELVDDDYRVFKDVTYTAYFTDPTTNRTEQRRFNLRVTRNPIHVYVIRTDGKRTLSSKLPIEFYVSTFYADGTPARCRVNIGLKPDDSEQTGRRLMTVQTNRYGVAKVSGLRLPSDTLDDDVELQVNARDAKGKSGFHEEEFDLDEDRDEVRIATDKSLYRPGEPIVASVTSTIPDAKVVVDVARDSVVLHSQTARLSGGRAVIEIAYRAEFKDRLNIAAYTDFADSEGLISSRTILFPRDRELRVDAQTEATSYRPGEEVAINFRVRDQKGAAVSALGLTIVDKAVDERFRTDGEMGSRSYGFWGSISNVLGNDDQIAGVTLRDLERVNMARAVPTDYELLAEILLNQTYEYRPVFFEAEDYAVHQQSVFDSLTRLQISPVREALATHYAATREYPGDELRLQSLLTSAAIDLHALRDPWGIPYQPAFTIDKVADVLSFRSAGADKHFGTDDDFSVESNRWAYFLPVGEAINNTVRKHHETTGGFIRDFETLRSESATRGFDLQALRDRWSHPYRFTFEIDQTNFVIKVSSSGPDARFEQQSSSWYYYAGDDFLVWTSTIDYFAEARAKINAILEDQLKNKNHFPQNEQELSAALRDSDFPECSLQDAWGHPYYATFATQPYYSDRVRIENRGRFGDPQAERVYVTPVTARAATIFLRSAGADGKVGTADDFSVANFSGVITEQAAGETKPKGKSAPLVLSGTNGAISGIITDPNGAVIPGATITVTSSTDSQVRTTTSNDAGFYSVANLSPGIYQVCVEAANFKSAVVTDVTVGSSTIVDVNIVLQAGSVSETVTVSASAEQVQTNSTDYNLSRLVKLPAKVIVARGRQFQLVTKSGSGPSSTPRLREYFPETLLWQPSLETDSQGRAQLKFKLADNITTWKMSVIGSTEDGQIGTVEKEIKAFQPFFVEHDPPRILTEGDEISLPVVVRNYLERPQPINLEIKPESWFASLGPVTKRSTVASGDATRETFDFRATSSVKDGKQRITVTGVDANDAIEKPVTVHPDGEERSLTASDIVSAHGVINLDIPANAIANSVHAELKIYPNLLAHVSESVEGIMSRPHGCGEQTISSSYPSLLLLKHYQKTGQDSPMRAKAQQYLRQGYERLLNYRDGSGGFTYWGHGEPDLALTAYALRFLTEARTLIEVDEKVIDEAASWLAKQQRADGSWSTHDIGSNAEDKTRVAILTAYVARVLAMSAAADKTRGDKLAAASVKRALSYLSGPVEKVDEPYLIASYALAAIEAHEDAQAARAIVRLRALAHEESGAHYWSLETNTPFYGWGSAGRIETTALALQAIARVDRNSQNDRLVRGGILFLLKQKDRYGVWYSTQATINVLDALLALLAVDVAASRDNTSSAEVTVNGTGLPAVQLPANQLNGPITIDLSGFVRAGRNKVELTHGGESSPASVQAVATYYVPWQDAAQSGMTTQGSSSLRLVTRFDKTEAKVSDEITCHVEAERIGFHGYGMMLAEIGLPPGADIDRASLDKAMAESDWSIDQYDILPDRVVVYLWPRAGGSSFDIKFKPRFGLKAKSAASVVYDYYNPEARATVAPTRFMVK